MLTNFTSLKFVLVVLIISILMSGHKIAQEHFHYMPSNIGWHEAVYDGNKKDPKLVPWTTWDDASEREIKWYLNAPINKHGYPAFVHITFMDELYQSYRDDFIPATQKRHGH